MQTMITKDHLKQKIEQLDDDQCLESIFRLLQQFPHQGKTTQKTDALQCSREIDYAITDTDDSPVFTEIEK
jgi:hypothetical protein